MRFGAGADGRLRRPVGQVDAHQGIGRLDRNQHRTPGGRELKVANSARQWNSASDIAGARIYEHQPFGSCVATTTFRVCASTTMPSGAWPTGTVQPMGPPAAAVGPSKVRQPRVARWPVGGCPPWEPPPAAVRWSSTRPDCGAALLWPQEATISTARMAQSFRITPEYSRWLPCSLQCHGCGSGHYRGPLAARALADPEELVLRRASPSG